MVNVVTYIFVTDRLTVVNNVGKGHNIDVVAKEHLCMAFEDDIVVIQAYPINYNVKQVNQNFGVGEIDIPC